MEETVLNLIMHTGEARMYAAEAISSAKSNDYTKAKKLIQKANEELGYAHNSQSSIIQGEKEKENNEISLLLMHGEDHLMTVMLFIDIAREIVEVYEKFSNI